MEVNPLLPYPFIIQANGLSSQFTTTQGILYEATFTQASNYFPNYSFASEALEFSIYALEGPERPISFDARIGLTITAIIMGRFMQNPQEVICYVCDQADARAFKRAMRFARLFEQDNAEQQVEKADVEVSPLYASILFYCDHPVRIEIEQAAHELVGKLSDEEE